MKVMRSAMLQGLLWAVLMLVTACAPSSTSEGAAEEGAVLALPDLAPVESGAAQPLRVVATTSLIGDVVAQVGGDQIALTTLMGPGQDPHSYEPSTSDLTRVAEADVIFINGWNLEEGLVDDLDSIAGDAPLVPVSAGIEPMLIGPHGHEDEADDGAGLAVGSDEDLGAVDPHVWLDPQNVQRWAQNIQATLSSLDPANAADFAANAETYSQELTALQTLMEERLAQIPQERRKLVTNHDSLAYFARRFDFEIVGTVIPAASTVAEPSAQEMVRLVQKMQDEGVCAIFAESTANARLAETVAAELDNCQGVQVLALYTGALGPEGSGGDSYVQMMRVNTERIVQGLGNGG